MSQNDDTWAFYSRVQMNAREGYFVDVDTGEILSAGQSGSGYIKPIDISAIVAKDIYEEVVRSRVGKRRYKLWISPLLLDVVIDKALTIPALSVLCFLGQKIGYNNMVYITLREIGEGSGYGRQAVSKALTELRRKGFLREVGNKLEERDSRFFLVNPLYFFLGYYPVRDLLLKDWVMG